jgi:hypothetical protein
MKIAICVPHHGDVRGGFAISLAEMMIHASRVGVIHLGKQLIPELGIFHATGSLIARNRQRIADTAKEHGAEFLMWLDTDHTFPPDTLARLFKHMGEASGAVSVVACNYPRRCSPTGPTALNITAEGPTPVYTTREKVEARIVEQVDHVGFGVLLMRASVLDLVERPWFVADELRGEDGYFFHKLLKHGIRPFIDHHLSWQVAHLAVLPVSNADAVADRELWSGPWIDP